MYNTYIRLLFKNIFNFLFIPVITFVNIKKIEMEMVPPKTKLCTYTFREAF